MNILKNLKTELNKEHYGFAICLEVIVTLAMIFIFLNMNLYVLRVMNVQRYMNTVMTSTAAQAARWGGADSEAYAKNISSTPLLKTAQNQLNMVAMDFSPKISATPDKIKNSGDEITVTIKYHLPPVFSTMSKVYSSSGDSFNMYNKTRNMKMQIKVRSIMEAGKLL